jgi:hypothetical protein
MMERLEELNEKLETLNTEASKLEQLEEILPSPPSKGEDKKSCFKVPLLKDVRRSLSRAGDLGGSETLNGEASKLEQQIAENVAILLGVH